MSVDLTSPRPSLSEEEPTLRQLWDCFYDSTALERFDLHREWHLVETAGNLSLREALLKRFTNLGKSEAVELAEVLTEMLAGRPPMPQADRSILFGDLVVALDEHVPGGYGRITRALKEFIFEGRRAPYLRELPAKIMVEIANNCNLNCVMCGVGARGYDPSRTMSLSFFEELCRTTLHRADIVRLNGLGESTIVPGFPRYLDAIEGTGSGLELVTNLTVPDRSIWERLLDLDVMLFVSCDAVVPVDLARIRRGLDVGRFSSNLQLLAEESARRHRDPLRIQIIMTLLESNFTQLPDMVDFAARHRVGGVIANMVKGGEGSWKLRRYGEILETFRRAHERSRARGVQLMVPDQIEGLPVALDFAAETNSRTCPTYLKEAFVRYNGDVCTCNMMNPYVYGNLRRNTLEEIVRAVPSLLFDYLMSADAKHPYCRNCYYLRKRDGA